MPISVKCPECDTAYKVPDEAAGKAIKCKKCGAKVPVPAAGGDDDDLSNLGGTGDGGGDTKEKKKAGSRKLLLIIGGIVLLFGCCCVLPPGIGGLGWYIGWFQQDLKDAFKDIGKDMPKDMKKKASLDRRDRLAPSVPRMAFTVLNPVREAFWPEVSIVRLAPTHRLGLPGLVTTGPIVT
jgi:predicted Zn finger-like uncharacterized protein